jgi:hypothetical protein
MGNSDYGHVVDTSLNMALFIRRKMNSYFYNTDLINPPSTRIEAPFVADASGLT